MSREVSTVQSLRAVDAWIDVINANINGGVRTAFKASRLKFAGSNVDVVRGGSASRLPMQLPEPSLTAANTVIDFSQGAITASTENTHLAIQGTGFFMLVDPTSIKSNGSIFPVTAAARFLITRDGDFRTNAKGQLVHSCGYYLVTAGFNGTGLMNSADCRTVYNDLEITTPSTTLTAAVRLSDFLSNASFTNSSITANGSSFSTNSTWFVGTAYSIVKAMLGIQNLHYSSYGSTIFDFGATFVTTSTSSLNPAIGMTFATTSDATILSKSLEASNASMTQSVPELSLAQKLFSALTKILQTSQTNADSVLNLVR